MKHPKSYTHTAKFCFYYYRTNSKKKFYTVKNYPLNSSEMVVNDTFRFKAPQRNVLIFKPKIY